jgi:hypothetical protein
VKLKHALIKPLFAHGQKSFSVKLTWEEALVSLMWLYRAAPFLAHLAKGNVNFCHHLASGICRPTYVIR